MTALSIIQDATGRMSLQQPSAIFSSTDSQVIQLRTLLNESGKKLNRMFDWQVLTKETSFTTVAAETQTGAVPEDFDHYINESMFNRTSNRKVYGPMTPSEWQKYKSGFSAYTFNPFFRLRGGNIIITPTPTAGESVYYEYISKYWCESEGGTEKSAMTADTDVALIDEELLTKDLIWRFLKAKGLDYSEAFIDFQVEATNLFGKEPAKIINMSNDSSVYMGVNVPEGNWTL